MSLRLKVIILLIGVLIAYLAAVFAVERLVILPAFTALEREAALKDAQRIKDAIDRDVTYIGRKCSDWANWDDSYEFVASHDPAFVESNLTITALQGLDLHLIGLFDADGKTASVLATNAQDEPVTLPEFPATGLELDHPLRLHDMNNLEEFRGGILPTKAGPMLVVSRLILTSDATGPGRGTIIMGRFIDDEYVQGVSHRTLVDCDIWSVGDPRLPAEAAAYAASGSDTPLITLFGDQVQVIGAMADIDGRNSLIIRSRLPRDITRQGDAAVRFAIAALIAFGTVVVGAILVLVQWKILSPLSRLTLYAVSVGRGEAVPEGVDLGRDDELGRLAREVNNMIERLASHIHQYKDSQSNLIASEARYRAVVDDQSEFICRYTPDTIITFANDACCRCFGVPREALVGSSYLRLFPESERAKIRENIARLGHETLSNSYEVQVSISGGPRRWHQWTDRPITGPDARIIEIQSVGRDVTDLKRALGDLEHARDAAEASNRAKSEFLANMSHEIRTPMTAILGYSDLLITKDTPDDMRHDCALTIRRNGEHLLSIINDILDLSKIEAGRMTIEQVNFAPRQIIEETASLMRVRAAEKKLTFSVTVDDQVPGEIASDPVRVRQIVMNLLSNAIKFTEKGEVALTVTVMGAVAEGANCTLRIDVRDSGIGMTPDQVGRLFRPFTQADTSTTRKFGGTGLGLTICRRLAQMLGGDITVSSAPGAGSVFSAHLQARCISKACAIEATERAEAAAMARRSGRNEDGQPVIACPLPEGGRILIAEDGPDNQRLFTFHLSKAGHQVTLAENGRVAVEEAVRARQEGRPFEVVFMDMQMPEVDGYTAAARLRAEGFTIPIIALTAHAMTGDREKCIQAGCNDYATKPIAGPKLREICAKYVALVRAGQARHSAA